MNLTRLIHILLVVNLLFAGLVAASWFASPYEILPMGNRANEAEDVTLKLGAIPQRKPFSEYERQMLGRKLFRYGLEEKAPVVQRSIVDDFSFLGSSQSPAGRRGFIRNTISGETRSVVAGDKIGDYEVRSVEDQRIALLRDGKEYSLKR